MYVWGALCETDRETVTLQDTSKVARFPIRHPHFPPEGQTVTSFSVGQKHIVAVAGGVVYGMGNNSQKQLGKALPGFVETFRPVGFSSQSPVVQVVCGLKHTMIRTEDGNVYTSGDNTFRQLGHATRAAGWNPIRVAHVKHIASGGNTCYAVTTKGEVYSWGSVRHGSLGHGTRGEKERMKSGAEEYEDVVQPTVIEWFVNKRVKIVDLSAGKEHFVCRDEKGEAYVCGDGSYGKLGQGDAEEQLEPVRLAFAERKHKETLVAVAAGGDQTLILKESSEFGSILYFTGRIGSGHDRHLTPELFTIPTAPSVVRIGASIQHCFAISADGIPYVWGQNMPTSALGCSARARRSAPSPICGLDDGKFITDVQSSQFLFVAVADDTKLKEGAVPEAIIPFRDRVNKDQLAKLGNSAYDYDAARRATLSMLLSGDDTADTYIATLAQPAEEEAEAAYQLTKKGAGKLNVGSKVRVWMTDVYALAKITQKEMVGHNKNEFEVAWVRDDWDDEIIELQSDDETLNEENENRWQKLWFLPGGDDDE